MNDKDLLDWLEVQGVPGYPWIARQSTTGRGYRLHQYVPRGFDDNRGEGSPTVRDAIRKAMCEAGEAWRLCAHGWEDFVADGRVPYKFCRNCKSTLYQGLVYPLKEARDAKRDA